MPSHSVPNLQDEAAFAGALGQAIGTRPPGSPEGQAVLSAALARL